MAVTFRHFINFFLIELFRLDKLALSPKSQVKSQELANPQPIPSDPLDAANLICRLIAEARFTQHVL